MIWNNFCKIYCIFHDVGDLAGLNITHALSRAIVPHDFAVLRLPVTCNLNNAAIQGERLGCRMKSASLTAKLVVARTYSFSRSIIPVSVIRLHNMILLVCIVKLLLFFATGTDGYEESIKCDTVCILFPYIHGCL